MNHVFHVVWHKSIGAFVVVSEHAKSQGKRRNGHRRRKHVLPIFFLILTTLGPSMAQAASRYWDPNATAVGLGGTGVWNTLGVFWSPSNDGVSGPFSAWNNAALDDAFFVGTAGTVTLGTPISVHNLSFQTSGNTLTGGTLTFDGASPTITVSGANSTINSVIAGNNPLRKLGAGILFLNGVNTFTGAVQVEAGGLTVNGNSALGAAANNIIMFLNTTLNSVGALARNVSLGFTGQANIGGAGVGSALFGGTGGLTIAPGVTMSNNLNNYTGQTIFFGDGNSSFTSIRDLGLVSSLGAPTTVANGTIRVVTANNAWATATYIGTGDSSNRNWQLQGAFFSGAGITNAGTGLLTLTGNIAGFYPAGSSLPGIAFTAQTADLALLGVISHNSATQPVTFSGTGLNRTITLGAANTYSGVSSLSNLTLQASKLANTGTASSLGTGSNGGIALNNAALSYTGTGDSSNRAWTINGDGRINNNGSGALLLSGAATFNAGAPTLDQLRLGGTFTGLNTLSGLISGVANVVNDAGTWLLSNANTYVGDTIVNGGNLRAGTAQAFGLGNDMIVNGGVLDLNNFDMEFPTLAGTGGTVALGTADITLNAAAGVSASYAGTITGSGGLIKQGASTQILSGASTYTGATTVGGGTLRLDYAAAGAPSSNIISSASTLNMGGGTLFLAGANGVANTQTFNGLNVTGGGNNITATSGTGGSLTVNLGAISRTGGLVNFNLPSSGNITTSNTLLGGWATVNGTDYAKVVGGNIQAFLSTDYTNKDNSANWLNNEYIADTAGFFGTLASSRQLAGLRYAAPAVTTLNVAPGQTLGVDGTIIVGATVGARDQIVTGGSMTGTSGGGVLGIQQRSTGNFAIASRIVDNGGSIGFTKAGTGLVSLTNLTSNYTGPTIISGGTLAVSSIGNGGAQSSIGASSAAPSNLVIENGTLRYMGGTATTDRGFTLLNGGPSRTLDVNNAASNLTFSGLVTSADEAGLIKAGAGTLTLANGANSYIGATEVTGGTLGVSTLSDGGLVSGIGAAGSAASKLLLNGGTLMYNGATTSSNRGFTVGLPGAGGSSGGVGVSNATSTLTLSGTAVGDDGFRKEGAGTLVLTGTNTYTGHNTVNAGTLRAGSTQAFGSGSNVLGVASGATADLNNFANTISSLNGAGNVVLGSAPLVASGGVATGGNFNGTISGTGGFTRSGGSFFAQNMSGCNNSYTGATTLNGRLVVNCLSNGGQASGIGASTNGSANLVFLNGVLTYTGDSVSIDRGFSLQSGTGTFEVSNALTTLALSGTGVGAAALGKSGAGTLLLSGNNIYTGGTSVSAGTLRAGSTTAFGTGGMTLSNAAGAALDLNGFSLTVAWINGGGTTGGNINLGAQTLALSLGNSAVGASYAGNLSGTGSLIKNGAQTQRLTGCNSSYTGTTTINAGALEVNCLNDGGGNSAIGASSAAASNLILNGGTLSYVGTSSSSDHLFTLGTSGGTLDASGTGALQLTNTGAIALSGINTARTLTLTGTNTAYNVLAGQLTNNGTGLTGLAKVGTGTWQLTNNASSYTGATTINGGVLAVSQLANGGLASGIGASSSAASNLVLGNNSTLRYTGAGDSTDRLFTLAAGTTFIESSGTGAIDFTNAGAIALAGSNTPRTIALGGTNVGNNTLTATIANNGTGVTTLAKNDSGTWALTGNNIYTGNTVINNGNLMIGNGGTTGNLGTGNVIIDSPTSTLSMNRSNNVTFNTVMSGPGSFAQVGTGITTLTADNSVGTALISAGTLDVNGVLNTATVNMSGTSTLNIDGTVQAAGATFASISGDAGTSTINVNSAGTLRGSGDLGDGSDTLNIHGTLDMGPSPFSLSAGDDRFVWHDGAVLTGAGIDAGAGTGDNLVFNNALALSFDGTVATAFELLTKQNSGTLTLNGNQSFSTGTAIRGGTLDVNNILETPTLSLADNTTLNVDGTVESVAGGITTVTGSAGSNVLQVNTGATLNANGDLGDGSDSLALAGSLNTGAAVLSLGEGDDSVTLADGALITGVGLGAGVAGSDLLVLNNALALTFDGGQMAGFENLLKQNAGTATMAGTQSFSAGTTIAQGALDIDGALQTSTIDLADNTALNVDGTVQATGPGAATLTGSAGTNTVTVTGTLWANGDLGGGSDAVDVAGTLNTGGQTLQLGDGDDTLTIHDNTQIFGTVAAGLGNDTFNTNIATVANLGAVQGFETLSKTGSGTLNINGPLDSDFNTVDVLAGTLDITANGGLVAPVGQTLTTRVASGATLNVDGTYSGSAGDDTFDLSGTVSGAGTLDLGNGADTLTLNDGALLNNIISAGAGSDSLVLNNALALGFSGANATGFELLQKNNAGEATLTGNQVFSGGIALNGGALTLTGDIDTPTVTMADNTVLNVNVTLDAGGATATAITGSTGINTLNVGAGNTLIATGDLGAGNDVLNVTGTLNTGSGTLDLGDGDDNFIIQDGSAVVGTVDGGAGSDTRTFNINATANLGTLTDFEGVTKTGTGILNLNGPGSTDLQDVQVLGGTLNVLAGASIVAALGQSLNAVVGTAATLNVGGDFGCGTGSDTLNVSGTVSGSGSVNLCGGDDTLTLNDGSSIAGLISPIDGDTGADQVVLNNAAGLTLDGSDIANFEALRKNNSGEAALVGAHSYSGGVVLNGGILTLNGTMDAPTVAMSDNTVLNVNNLLQASGGGAAVISGSAGINTINVADGGLLVANGDLGDSADVLSVRGTLDSDGGVLSLGAGDDTFAVFDTTDTSNATIDGGTGNDLLNVTVSLGSTVPLGGLQGFESLDKFGLGELELRGLSDFIDVDLNDGTLRVTDTGSVTAQNTTILAGGVLDLADNGSYSGTASDDTFTVAGTVLSTGSNAGTLDLGDGNDSFTIQDGANLSGMTTPVSGGAGNDTFVANLAGSAVLGGATDFETLTKTNSGILHVNGPALSSFATVNIDGGTLDIGMNGRLEGVQNARVASGASLIANGVMAFTSGTDTLTVAGNVSGSITLDLLDGDDQLILQDGADFSGLANPIDGGAGIDTLTADIAGTSILGGVTQFETLNKTNSGTLIIAGPAPSDFSTANVGGGTLDIGVNGSINDVVTTSVANGATLNVDGDYSGSIGDDSLNVAGTISGSGLLDLGEGDDVMTLNDGASIAMALGGELRGGTNPALDGFDLVVLNNASDLTFDGTAVSEFEYLRKDNIGIATLTASHDYFDGISITGGKLVVDGNLLAPTLDFVNTAGDSVFEVNGVVQADADGDGVGDSLIAVTGDSQANQVVVGASGTLRASGDLGDGNDTLDVAGILDAGGGAFTLGDGDDNLVVHDGTTILGAVLGGAGFDTRIHDLIGTANIDALLEFEGLTKRGVGILNLTGPATSELVGVSVEAGLLNIAASANVVAQVGSPLNTRVLNGATMNVDGNYTASAGADAFMVAGTVSGSGLIDLGEGDDVLTLKDGALIAMGPNGELRGGTNAALDGFDRVVLDNVDDMTFDGSVVSGFEELRKDNTGTATLTGAHDYLAGTSITGGTLVVEESLITPTLDFINTTGDSILEVNGLMQADVDGDGVGDSQALLTGDSQANKVIVARSGTLRATGDLGAGDDTLDVIGVLDASGGTFSLGDGDDSLEVRDDTIILGTVSGGAGFDTRVYNLAGTADVDALVQFEGLTKRGNGTLNLTGPSTSEVVGVVVESGELNVATGANVVAQAGGALDTEVRSGATLTVDGAYGCGTSSDSFDISGHLTGGGRIDLCGGNDTVILHDGGDIEGFTGTIEGGAHEVSGDTLMLDNAEARRLSATHLSGFEVLHKVNSGTATLVGDHQFSLRTQVDAGELNVAGNLTSAQVVIADGGALVGSGRIIGNVQNDGRIAPGNSIGTLSVSGGVTFAPTSTYGAEIEPGGVTDLLAVTGAVTIQGGTVDVTSAPGSYVPGMRWNIITASDGVTGTFADSVFSAPFLDLEVNYDPNTVYLEIERNDTSFTQLAQTGNQLSVASGLDSMSPSAALPQAVAGLTNPADVPPTYDLLSGEIHSTLYGTLMQDSRFVSDATLRRGCNAQDERHEKQLGKELDLSSCAPLAEHHQGGFTLWTQVFESQGTIDGRGNGNVENSDRRINGLFIGGDVAVGNDWRVGLVSGYERSDLNVDKRQSSADIDTYHLGAYANGPLSTFEARTGVIHSLSQVDTRRNVELTGANQALKANYDVATTQVFIEMSHRERFGAIELEPFANLTWVHQEGESFTEKGGSGALQNKAQTKDLGYSILGVRGATKIAQTKEATFLATGSVGWQHLLSGYTPERTQQFAGSSYFDIEGAPLARDSVPVEAGVAIKFPNRGVLSVSYRGQFSDSSEDHGASISLSVPF